jgi:hypothetical protein
MHPINSLPIHQLSPPVITTAQTSGNNLPVSVVTPTFSATPTIPTSSLVDVKRNSPSSISMNLFNSKNSRIAPRPIKPKGRGRGQSSLTRSVMEQLKLIRRADNEKQNDNNGTFTPISMKPLSETSKSQTQMLPQLTSQLSKVQMQQKAPQVHQVQIQPILPQIVQPLPSNSASQQSSSTNKSISTPIPIAPKPPVQQLQQRKIIAEDQTSVVLIDRSKSPIIDPGNNNNIVEMDAIVESNGVESSHDKSGEDDLTTNSENTEVSLINGEITIDNVNNVNTTGLVSNIEELEQVQN